MYKVDLPVLSVLGLHKVRLDPSRPKNINMTILEIIKFILTTKNGDWENNLSVERVYSFQTLKTFALLSISFHFLNYSKFRPTIERA